MGTKNFADAVKVGLMVLLQAAIVHKRRTRWEELLLERKVGLVLNPNNRLVGLGFGPGCEWSYTDTIGRHAVDRVLYEGNVSHL